MNDIIERAKREARHFLPAVVVVALCLLAYKALGTITFESTLERCPDERILLSDGEYYLFGDILSKVDTYHSEESQAWVGRECELAKPEGRAKKLEE